MVTSNSTAGPSSAVLQPWRDDSSASRKSGLSCAECRRSKLKCDRVFPCQSCIRRGCAAICPDGALSATKGNKVLIARVERLQGQVKGMSSRIKELETALAEAQAQGSKSQHPLLAAGVKWEEPDEPNLPPESDTESLAGPPYDDKYDEKQHQDDTDDLDEPAHGEEMSAMDMHHLGLPHEIIQLATAFPLGVSGRPNLQMLFFQFIPRRERATELGKIYYQCSSWMYQPVPKQEFAELLDTIYTSVTDGTGASAGATPSTITRSQSTSHHTQPNPTDVHAHALALFFMILCIGSLYDAVHPDHELLTERYHAIARAALSSHSIVHHRACTTVQALFLLNLYKYITPRPSPEYRWLMSGICARLAQAMGLQRDCSGYGFAPEEVQRRRVVFWELFVFETWTSLLSGRPSLLNLRQINCRFPEDRDPVNYNGEIEIGFHSWLYRFAAGCMSLAVQHVFSSRKPTYAMLLELDAKIRRFPVPRYLRAPLEVLATPWSDDPHIAMQQFCQYGHVEHTILYLHRSHFAQVRSEQTHEAMGRSIWAVYRSSARLIRGLTSLYARHPEMTSKMWYFWSAYYSASIAIGCLALDNPWCQLSPHALSIVIKAAEVYEQGSRTCSIPSTLRILQNLVERSRNALVEYQRSNNPKQCGTDCCVGLGPDDVRRFAEGEDELLPGETEMQSSPSARYASTSPPSSGNGDISAEPMRTSAPSSTAGPSNGVTTSANAGTGAMASVPSHMQSMNSIASTSSMGAGTPPNGIRVPNPYANYGQFMPSNIDNSNVTVQPSAYAPQFEEPWFYTPASAHAAFAMDYSPSSAEAFDGLNPWHLRKENGGGGGGPSLGPGPGMGPQRQMLPMYQQGAQPLGSMPFSGPTQQTPMHTPNPEGPGFWPYGPPPRTQQQHAGWG